MKIDIWSDYVCPFCTVGERHLALALEKFEGRDDVEIVWRSFELDPTAEKNPTESMVDYLVKRKGMPKEQVESMNQGLAQRAADVGLEFNWQNAVSGNTRDAHRLGHLAREKGVGNEWDKALKLAYFTEGRNISDDEVMKDIAAQVGLDAEDVESVLGSNEYDDRVQADINQAVALGVQGVPFFVFDGRLGVSGAQPVEVFTQALEQAAATK